MKSRLIRWTSAQVRVFAYFNNIVLICAFLGIGLGVALGRRWPGRVHLALPGLLLLAAPLAFSESLQLVGLRFPDQSIMLWGAQEVPANAFVFVRNIAIFLALQPVVQIRQPEYAYTTKQVRCSCLMEYYGTLYTGCTF